MPVSNTQPVYPPASGAPVASVWGQAVSQAVVQVFTSAADRDAKWTNPPNGSVCVTNDTGAMMTRRAGVWQPLPGAMIRVGCQAINDVATSNPGWYDLNIVEQSTTFPYPTVTSVWVAAYGGYAGGGAVNFGIDVMTLVGSNVYGGQVPVQSITAAWAPVPVSAAWNNASNAVVGFKVRVNYQVGGNIHTGGIISWLIYAV